MSVNERIEKLKKLFLNLDLDNSGYINKNAFDFALKQIGQKEIQEELVDNIFNQLSPVNHPDTNELVIDFDKFKNGVGIFLFSGYRFELDRNSIDETEKNEEESDFLSEEEEEEEAIKRNYIKKILEAYNIDKNGTIDKRELFNLLKNVLRLENITDEMVDQIMQKLDKDNSGITGFEGIFEGLKSLFDQDKSMGPLLQIDPQYERKLKRKRTKSAVGPIISKLEDFKEWETVTFEQYVAEQQSNLEHFSALPILTEKQFALYKTSFRTYDKDKSGYLDYDELKDLLTDLYMNTSNEMVTSVLLEMDSNGDKKISFREFLIGAAKYIDKQNIIEVFEEDEQENDDEDNGFDDELGDRICELTIQNEDLERKLYGFGIQLEQTENVNMKLTSEIENIKRELLKKDRDIKDLKDTLRIVTEQVETYKSQVEQLQDSETKYKKQYLKLKIDFDESQLSIQKKHDFIKEIQEENKKLQRRIQISQTNVLKLAELQITMEKVQNENENLKGNIVELQNLREKIQNLKDVNEALENQHRQDSVLLENSNYELQRLNNQHSQITNTLMHYKNDPNEEESLSSELAVAIDNQALQELRALNEELVTKNEQIKQQLESEISQRRVMEENWVQTKIQLSDIKAQFKIEVENLHEKNLKNITENQLLHSTINELKLQVAAEVIIKEKTESTAKKFERDFDEAVCLLKETAEKHKQADETISKLQKDIMELANKLQSEMSSRQESEAMYDDKIKNLEKQLDHAKQNTYNQQNAASKLIIEKLQAELEVLRREKAEVDVLRKEKTKLANQLEELKAFINDFAKETQNLDIIAQQELINTAKAIQEAAEQLNTTRKRRIKFRRSRSSSLSAGQLVEFIHQEEEGLEVLSDSYEDKLFEAANEITNSTSTLVVRSTEAQKEIIAKSKQKDTPKQVYNKDPKWAEGLISAAKSVAADIKQLVRALNEHIIQKRKKKENSQALESADTVIAAAKAVSTSTSHLLSAARAKCDPNSQTASRLNAAAKVVIKATQSLMKVIHNTQESEVFETAEDSSAQIEKPVPDKPQEGATAEAIDRIKDLEIRTKIAKLERELETAQNQLKSLRKKKYVKK